MPILADQHMHSAFSFDSKAEMEDMVKGSIAKGLKHIAFTEHNDFLYPVSEEFPKGAWDLNVDSYLFDLLTMRDTYVRDIHIGFGIEIGMQPTALQQNIILANSQPFDFIIGSVHLVNGVDTYDPKFYEGRSANEAINEYLDDVLKNIKSFHNYDVLGHLDYLTRTLPGGEDDYKPSEYTDKIDEILSILVAKEKGLELNTQALQRGLKNPNPCPLILKRYRELGGEIVTVGSDAHKPEAIGGCFDKASDILKEAGFNYYTVFTARVPVFEKL